MNYWSSAYLFKALIGGNRLSYGCWWSTLLGWGFGRINLGIIGWADHNFILCTICHNILNYFPTLCARHSPSSIEYVWIYKQTRAIGPSTAPSRSEFWFRFLICSIGSSLDNIINLVIVNTSWWIGKNTEIFSSINVDPVSLTRGGGVSE